MTYIIVGLLVLLFGSIIVSGIVHSRQQALAHKQSQLKLNRQKFTEVAALLNFILEVDNNPKIAIILSQALLDIIQAMIALDKHSEEFRLLYDNEITRQRDLRGGTLKPRHQVVVNSDAALRARLQTLNQTGHFLQRLKVRGQMTAASYEEHLHHLQTLSFESEYQSYTELAEQVAADHDYRKAAGLYKQAREAVKKTRVEIPDRNEKIRELSTLIEQMQKGKPADNNKGDAPGSSKAQATS